MKKLIPIIAAVIAVVGYAVATLAYHGTVSHTDSLLKPEAAPAMLTETAEEGLAPGKYIGAVVVRVVDGDTIEAVYKNGKYKVRLLDIDTPESVKEGVALQPFGKEASAQTKKLVLNKRVKLVFEKGLRDKYGRLLAYVMLENGDCLNAILVRNGFARVEIVSPNTAYKAYFNQLQKAAIGDKSGFWALPQDKQPFTKDDKGEYIPKYWVNEKVS